MSACSFEYVAECRFACFYFYVLGAGIGGIYWKLYGENLKPVVSGVYENRFLSAFYSI